MKVLMISGDPNLLKTGAEARERLVLQRSTVERLDVFVWPSVHSVWQVLRATRDFRYDVVTSQDPFWRGLLGLYVARRTGARLNLQVHADLKGQSWVKWILARFLLRRADSIRPQSERVALEVKELGAKAPTHVLPVFIDLARVTGLSRTHHPHFEKTILWIGRFEAEKDPLTAIATLRDVRSAGVDAGLIMLGSGLLEAELKSFAQDLPVEFPGWQDPAPYLAQADVVLSTSPFESYGASIVEALAAGVSVVAPDVGVAKEAGAIVVPRERLAEAVIDVLKRGTRGTLRLELPNAEEWARRWKETL